MSQQYYSSSRTGQVRETTRRALRRSLPLCHCQLASFLTSTPRLRKGQVSSKSGHNQTMKPIFPQLFATCVAFLVGAQVGQQEPLLSNKIMAQPKVDKVPGHSDAIYGPVPKEDQIFRVEFLEIAPTPIVSYGHRRPQNLII